MPEGVLKNFAKFTERHLYQSLFLIKLQTSGPDIKRPWHRCFPVNFAKFLRKSFLTENLRWLLLSKMWLVLQFSIFRVSSFIEDFLLISFQQKNEIKKGKYPDRVQIFTFSRAQISLTSKISKEIWQMAYFKANLMLQFSWLEEFREGMVSGWWTLDELQYENGSYDQL